MALVHRRIPRGASGRHRNDLRNPTQQTRNSAKSVLRCPRDHPLCGWRYLQAVPQLREFRGSLGPCHLLLLLQLLLQSWRQCYHVHCKRHILTHFPQQVSLTITQIPAEQFPTRYRCTCHGLSAASGKFGSVVVQLAVGLSGATNLGTTSLGNWLLGYAPLRMGRDPSYESTDLRKQVRRANVRGLHRNTGSRARFSRRQRTEHVVGGSCQGR